jgi:hypothetical protein
MINTHNHANTPTFAQQGEPPDAQTVSIVASAPPPATINHLLWRISSPQERVELVDNDTSSQFKDQLSELAADPEQFQHSIEQAFGDNVDAQATEQLRQRAVDGDYSWLPEIRYVTPSILNGANGAYSEQQNVIFINSDLIGTEEAQNTFAEEASHHIDKLINSVDTQGDEGELFARMLNRENLTRAQLSAIQSENDTGQLSIDGETLDVEFRQTSDANSNVDEIARLLDSDGWNQWVSRGEVITAGELIVDDATFEELEERGLLDDLFKEIYDAGHVGGGMTPEARREFYARMAENLSGENLVKLANQAKQTTNNFDHSYGYEAINEITTAVIDNANGQTNRVFAEGIIDDDFLNSTDGASSVSGEATAVQRILSSLDEKGWNNSLDRLLNNLSEDELQVVTKQAVAASALEDSEYPESFTDLANVISEHADEETRQQFLESSLDTFYNGADFQSDGSFRPLADAPNAERVLDGITQVFDKDVIGATTHLQRQDSSGALLSQYTNHLLETGNQEKIAEHLDTLQGADSSADSDFDFLTADTYPGADSRYGNAINLGYYLGSVAKGVNDAQSEESERLNTLQTLASFVLDYLGKGGAKGSVLDTLAFKRGTVVANFFTDQTLSALASGNSDKIISELTADFPDDPNGGNATHPAFDDYVREISRLNG